jgi:hypothetical protein
VCDESTNNCVYRTTLTWYDSSSGLLWEVTPSNPISDWQPAVSSCAALTLCGKSDWRLPTVSELRTLIRGCATAQTGGSCALNDNCLSDTCDTNCSGCPLGAGPAAGNYWPAALMGNSGTAWSSSSRVDDPAFAWTVYFYGGSVGYRNKLSTSQADAGGGRCVRTGP